MNRDSLIGWLLIFRNVVIFLVLVAVGEALPPLQALEQWVAPRREALTWWVGGVAAAGFALLMGGMLYRIATGAGSLTRKEIADQVGRVKSYNSAPMAVACGWRVWLPKRAWGAGFSDEISIGQFKQGWARQLWRRDSRWCGIFIMAVGALLMLLGLFGLPMILGGPGFMLVFGLLLAYALIRIIAAFLRKA